MELFLWGCVGGLAPEIVRLYKGRLSPVHLAKSFWVISLLYVALAGAMAVLFAGSTPQSAFYVGVSTPFLVSGLHRMASMAIEEGEAHTQPTAAADSGKRVEVLSADEFVVSWLRRCLAFATLL